MPPGYHSNEVTVIAFEVRLSIIIPVYCVEKHIKTCLDSVLKAGSESMEIILVDDGSPDGCPALCDAYERQYSCVRVIHRENGGLAAARNTGLDAASGEWVTFIDADDYVEDGCFDRIGDCLNREDDIILFPHYIDYPHTGEVCKKELPELRSVSPGDGLREAEKSGVFNMVWNKLYRRGLLEREPLTRFEVNSEPGEDLLFNSACFVKAGTVSLMNHPYYHWVRRGEDTLANRFRRDLNEKNRRFIACRNSLYHALSMDKTDEALLAKGNLAYIFVCIPNMYRRKNRFPRKERLAFYREILASEDVARWTESPAVVNPLLKQFKRLYRTGSPGFMDAYYAAALWGRQSFDGLWQIIRKRMHR